MFGQSKKQSTGPVTAVYTAVSMVQMPRGSRVSHHIGSGGGAEHSNSEV